VDDIIYGLAVNMNMFLNHKIQLVSYLDDGYVWYMPMNCNGHAVNLGVHFRLIFIVVARHIKERVITDILKFCLAATTHTSHHFSVL
jgi:hypothetical protein